jgi:hypothetical protein
MGLGGRWVWLVLLLGSLFLAFDARAGDSGPGPRLVFEASAEGLPQGEIRAAVEKELGKPLASWADTGVDELAVSVDAERRIVLRYKTKTGSVERYLPMPSEPSDVPLIISLAAGNLARHQAQEFERPPVEGIVTTFPEEEAKPKPAEPRTEPPPPVTKPPSEPDYQRNFFGFHVAQDIAIVGGSNVCDANLGQKSDNYACFYEGTENPFWHTPFPYQDSVETGPVLATTRLLFSYDRALSRVVSMGARFGYAFGGGPPAGQAPAPPYSGEPNLNLLPDDVPGEDGTAFFPWHLELRVTAYFIPIGRGFVNPYVGASVGAAQVDSKITIDERDCSDVLDPSSAAAGTFEECRQGDSNFDWRELQVTRVDAWKKMGQAFVSLNTGATFNVDAAGGFVANLNMMYMLPATGIVFEPSLGGFLKY